MPECFCPLQAGGWESGVPLRQGLEPSLGCGNGFVDILLCYSSVQKMIVMTGEEYTPLDAFSDPSLMQHQTRIIRDPQLKQGRFSRYMQVKTMLPSGLDQPGPESFPFAPQ